ncbi:helix-turn-helix transcriptional regulator, partial [Pigmentiphaga daeguensis]|uniref:helix-turn-helix domain-containing protein n=1 Tax=Pigmentiphaga daeguensis TaxID=414049 RepID=UPI0031D55DBA
MTFHLSTSAEILHALGVRLREQRLAQSLTQRELAQMAGLSLGALRKLESDGQCSLVRISANVTADFGNVTDPAGLGRCAVSIVDFLV